MVSPELLRQAIKDAFDSWELLDYMDVTVDELLDAFPDKWEKNEDLINALDIVEDEEDDE